MNKTTYKYSAEKNRLLIERRSISFEEIVSALDNGQLLDVIEQPNNIKYPNQQMFIVQIKEYVYVVPFVIIDDFTVFLKTIYPSRKLKKQYMDEVSNEN